MRKQKSSAGSLVLEDVHALAQSFLETIEMGDEEAYDKAACEEVIDWDGRSLTDLSKKALEVLEIAVGDMEGADYFSRRHLEFRNRLMLHMGKLEPFAGDSWETGGGSRMASVKPYATIDGQKYQIK